MIVAAVEFRDAAPTMLGLSFADYLDTLVLAVGRRVGWKLPHLP